jgi:hypothetical protein
MAYPPITPLPAAPSRNDPDNFSTEADAFVAALPALVTETNAAGVYTADQATAAAADAVLTAADVVSTNADVVSTGDDVTATAADRVQTGADVTTTLGYLDAFEGSYIGQYSDDAAADASGFTIGAGVFYFKDTGVEATSGLRIYNGSWGAAVLDAGGALLSVNNLSDVASAEIARDSLGLRWLVKSAAYTVVAGEKIAADVSGGAWTLTLPLTPVSGAVVMVSVIDGDAKTNNLTIDGNGNNIQGDTTLIYDVPLATVWLVYNNTEWRLA